MPHARDPVARRRLVALGAAGALALLVGVAVGASSGGGEGDGQPADAGRTGTAGARERPATELSLERAVGQLLVMSFDGVSAPAYIRRRLRTGEGAGVILFAKNAPDPATLRSLTRSLQRAASGSAIVATDQEGGDIRSIAFVGPESSQGVLTTAQAAEQAAGEAAAGLDANGINVNLAPVADVAIGSASVVAGRAYGAAREEVPTLVASAVRAHEERGVAATAKHFPGLGAAGANTDDTSVTVASSEQQIASDDLPAFRAALRERVPLVMASHALYPALDPDRIASQSSAVLEELLRGRLGFRGAVITDSIEAQAVLDRSGVAEAAVRSVEAGADLVLMTGSGSWNEVYPALLERARGDERFAARVQEAAARVAALRKRLSLAPAR